MCSILGYVNTRLSYEEVVKLNFTMSHRGPDDSTVKEYRFRETNIILAHNRLSIQDLELHANQPMENENYVIVFNGEIYNHHELRKECKNIWKSTSDTETLLELFSVFGIEKNIVEAYWYVLYRTF